MSGGMGEDRPGGPEPPRIRRRLAVLHRDEEAAAGVVSIMLAILVFIILTTIVTTTWLPEWMENVESQHMEEVNTQFSYLKSAIDKQILNGDTKFILGSPLTLGSRGVSVFSTDSTGRFSINQYLNDDLEFLCNLHSEDGEVNITSTGSMKYKSNNIHYVDQQLGYENGAIVLNQGEGEVIRAAPQFVVEKHGPVVHMSTTLITISGPSLSIEGSNTIIIESQLVTYTAGSRQFDTPQWVNITMTSEFPEAWVRYYKNRLIEAGLTLGTDFGTTITGNRLTVAIKNVYVFDFGYALVSVDVQDQAGGLGTPTGGMVGLVGLWHLNNATPGVCLDSSRFHNDGTISGNATFVPGVRYDGLAFDGDDHVAVPLIPAYDMADEMTLMAWVRWDVDPTTGVPWACVVNKHENQWEIQHSGNVTGTRNEFFEFALRTNESRRFVYSTTSPVAGVWYHLAGTYTNGELMLYVNGTLENSTALNGTIEPRAQGITVGARYHLGSYDRFFEGTIDEVVLYNRTLTADEIWRHYQSLKP